MQNIASPRLILSILCAVLIGGHVAQAAPPEPRELEITGKYLLIPVQSPSPGYRGNTVRVDVDGVTSYKFGVFLAPFAETVDAWGCIDVGEYVGKKAQISCDSGPADRWPGASALIKNSDEISTTSARSSWNSRSTAILKTRNGYSWTQPPGIRSAPLTEKPSNRMTLQPA